jgi:hypothetical protein
LFKNDGKKQRLLFLSILMEMILAVVVARPTFEFAIEPP